MLVAPNTGVWCPPHAIFLVKVRNNFLSKGISEIDYIVRDTQLISYFFGVIYCLSENPDILILGRTNDMTKG